MFLAKSSLRGRRPLAKTLKLAVWAFSLIFLLDSTLFVIDIHQNMPISQFSTPFDHFQILPTLAVNPNLILEPCLNQSNQIRIFFVQKSHHTNFLHDWWVGYPPYPRPSPFNLHPVLYILNTFMHCQIVMRIQKHRQTDDTSGKWPTRFLCVFSNLSTAVCEKVV